MRQCQVIGQRSMWHNQQLPRIISCSGPDQVCWQVLPAYHKIFTALSIQDVCGRGQLLKQSPARKTFAIDLSGTSAILKIFYAPTCWDRLRVWLGNSRALLEWNNILYLRDLGLPVAEPVALGRRGVDSYLILKKLENIRSLKEIMLGPLTDRPALSFAQRRFLAEALAALLSRLHEHHLLHQDLHFGNIMFDGDRLVLLDLHDLRRCKWMTLRRICGNLAMLGSSFTVCATTADYVYCLRKYWQQMPVLQAHHPWVDFVRRARESMQSYQLHFWRGRADKCVRSNQEFQKLTDARCAGFCRRDSESARYALTHRDAVITTGKILKDSRSSLVVATPYGILKQCRRKKWRNLIWDCFRPSRAKRAWLATYQCIWRGIPVPKALGFVEERVGPFLRTGYLLTEEVIQAQTLSRYLQSFTAAPEDEEFSRKQSMLQQLGRLVRLLHLRGLSHRDLKSNNFLVTPDERLYLIDLDGLSMPFYLTPSRRCKDMLRVIRTLRACQAITRTDIVRVLHSYLPFASSEELRRWFKKFKKRGCKDANFSRQ